MQFKSLKIETERWGKNEGKLVATINAGHLAPEPSRTMKHPDLFAKPEPSIGVAGYGCPAALEWRRKYDAHIRSAKWKNIRRDLFRMRGQKCEECGKTSPTLEVHHLTYDRLGNELSRDLKIVCRQCHKEEDKKREHAVAIKRETRRFNNAFNTWYERKYGCESYYAGQAEWEEFQDWIQSKQTQYYY
jgi:hypothetical protein